MTTFRKIIATITLVGFITIYSLLVMSLSILILPEASWWIQLIFYVIAGLFWVLPAGFIIWAGWRGEAAITIKRP